MTKEFEAKVKNLMGQVKYVKPGFLGLYMWWTEPLEAHESLRKAKKLSIADCLYKIADLDIQLKPRGYKGEYLDSAVEVLSKVPDLYLTYFDAYSLKLKSKFMLNTDFAPATLSLYRAIVMPDEIKKQEVIFDHNLNYENE